ncbi:hypothetical protein WR25_16226 [Diploscapter pachys]|uniref:Uncharacterized protein n=1 Tax=Diploscapter pachys TaxID=2018661 RepID=A0A2A2KS07_9BILA|nr:hypothetical protein WR25_16226 [Diploscapter pachys]
MLTPHFAPSKWDEAWYYSWMMNAWKGAVPDDQTGYMSMRQTPTILYSGCLISFWTLRKLATRTFRYLVSLGDHQSLEGWSYNYYRVVNSVVFSAPSLTPYDKYFPAYRIYTVDGNYPGSSFSVIDFEDWFFNLTLNNALPPSQAKWEQLYASVLKEYGLASNVPQEWHNFIERMKTDDALFDKFHVQFHHSNGKLCPDLPSNQPPSIKYQPTRTEI